MGLVDSLRVGLHIREDGTEGIHMVKVRGSIWRLEGPYGRMRGSNFSLQAVSGDNGKKTGKKELADSLEYPSKV